MSWWRAWELWLSGQPLGPGARLWGVPVLWWGRIGKLAEFAAGLIVLLDLIGPDRLRQWGGQATARTRRATRRVRLAQVERRLDTYHNDLYDRLYDDLSLASAMGWSPARLEVERGHGGGPMVDERMGATRYWRLLTELHASIRDGCGCAEPHLALCEEQMALVDGRVGELVEETASPEEREALRLHGVGLRAELEDVLLFAVPLVLLLVVLILAVPLVGSLIQATPVWALLVLGSVVLLLQSELVRQLLGLPLRRAVRSSLGRNARGEHRAWARGIIRTRRWRFELRDGWRPDWWPDAPLVWQVIRGLPAFALARPLAGLLDKAQPGHLLRWVAFVLFLLGFHFDLLAS